MPVWDHIQNPVILFDGVCNLCNNSVQQVLKRDKKRKFRFASLQGNFGQELLAHHHLPISVYNSFILFEKGKLYTRSTAALRVLHSLGGLWPLFYYVLIIVPAGIRNYFYDIIARNRYKWFGKRDSCWVPTPALEALFYS